MKPIYRYVINGVEFPSFRDAAATYNICHERLNKNLRSTDYPTWLKIDIETNLPEPKVGPGPKRQLVTELYIDDVKYNSVNEASKLLSIRTETIRDRLKSTNFPTYTSPQVDKEDRKPKSKPDPNKKRIKYVFFINDKRYTTIKDIISNEKVSKADLMFRLKSLDFPTWHCDEIQKQETNQLYNGESYRTRPTTYKKTADGWVITNTEEFNNDGRK